MTVEEAKSRIREAIESERDGAVGATIDEVMPALPLDARREVADWYVTAVADLSERIHHSDPDLPLRLREHVEPGETVADAWDRIPEPLQRQYTAEMRQYDPRPFRALPDPVSPVAPETYSAIKAIAFDLYMPEPDYAVIRDRIRKALQDVTALPAGEARQRTQGALLDAMAHTEDRPGALAHVEILHKVYNALWAYPTTTEEGAGE